MLRKSSRLIAVSAFGLKKEAAASNRIYGLTAALKPFFKDTVLISMDFGTDNHAYSEVKVVPVRLSILQKTVRKLLDLRKRKRHKSGESAASAAPGGLLHTLQYIWYAGGYNFPLLRFLIKTLSQVKQAEKSVLFVSSGPAAVLIVAVLVKKVFPSRTYLVCDFRDPVSNNPYIGRLSFTRFIRWIESSAIKNADLVTAVSRGTLEQLIAVPANSLVITNGIAGFNPAGKSREIDVGKIFYAGSIYTNRIASLKPFLAAIKRIEGAVFEYAGPDADLLNTAPVVNLGVVSKEEVLKRMAAAHVLLLLKAPADRGVLPGKFFEYLQTDRPVLVIGDSDEEFNQIAARAGGVFVVPPQTERIEQTLRFLLSKYAHGGVERNTDFLKGFTWNELGRKLAEKITAQDRTS